MTTSDVDKQSEMVNLLREALSALISSVESGFGFDHAMYQYSQTADNELSQAFAQVLEEVGSGTKRRVAVRDMAERMGIGEVSEFVEAIVQADEEGISILEVLKEQKERLGG